MRTAYWDSDDPEMYFDNPNLRWGDPAYLLEPGDPDYVPISPINPQPKTKTKKMKRQRYFPTKLADQIGWLVNFKQTLSTYATPLGLTPAQATAAVADAGWLVYVLQSWLGAVRTFGLTATQSSLLAQSGEGSAALVLPGFTTPALPASLTPQNPGALDRIFALVQQIKDSGKCTDDIATNLRIVGTAETGPDFTTIAPEFTVGIVGGHAVINWNWGGYVDYLESCEIQADRGDGKGYVLLTIDTTPGYTDTQPFPAVKTVWTYRAIYRLNDSQVGVWSAPVSIPVSA
jgi:hypothetical protein